MWLTAEDFVGTVTDLDTGNRVRNVAAVNVEEGLLERFRTDGAGRTVRDAATDEPIRDLYRGRFRADLRPREKAKKRGPILGANECVRCASKLVLPRDDLCAVCRAREQGRDIRVEPVTNVLDERPCDGGCGRSATWSVSDRTAVSPVRGKFPRIDGSLADVWFARGALIARWWYCSWCYRPPRVLDARGEVMTVNDEAGGCRPK